MQNILILDNYDSFTYNLVRYVKELSTANVDVYRNDKIQISDIARYDKIILSPGPGIPEEAGILKELIHTYGKEKAILGICLGCQAIAEVYGGQLENLSHPYHGISTAVNITDKEEILFNGIPDRFNAGRYHSWIVSKRKFPKILKITTEDDNGNIMGIRHKEYKVSGVQFHPESILTTEGRTIISNFLNN